MKNPYCYAMAVACRNSIKSARKQPIVVRRCRRNSIAMPGALSVSAVMALVGLPPAALAVTTITLHSFTGTPDGQFPTAGVVIDSAGNIFGTTQAGGRANLGTIFEVSATGAYRVAHNFAGNDGKYPFATLVRDKNNTLFGTAYAGGAYGLGVVYSLHGNTLKVLHSFTGVNDGKFPSAGVVLDATGTLYGTTAYGGAYGYGTVYKLAPDGAETLLYSFHGNMDGATPVASLVLDSSGNAYGVTSGGGAAGLGTVFEVSAAGNETVLHSFVGGTNDGAMPFGALVRDKAGTLYGTTVAGVADIGNPGPGSGTVFQITRDGTETLLYGFCLPVYCDKGANPYGGVTISPDGMLYGTGIQGAWAYGAVFGLNTATLQPTTLAYFANNQGNSLPDPNIGAEPSGPLALSPTGSLYGTTITGGASSGLNLNGFGSVYVVTP